jgi:hypothetical protein
VRTLEVFGDWYIAMPTPAITRITTATMIIILSFFFKDIIESPVLLFFVYGKCTIIINMFPPLLNFSSIYIFQNFLFNRREKRDKLVYN